MQLTDDARSSILIYMKARELLKVLKSHGCIEVRQSGSHITVQCGQCKTTVAYHAAKDIPKGTLRAIERDLMPCLGKGWLDR